MSRYAVCDWCDKQILLGSLWKREEISKWVSNQDGDFCDYECAMQYRQPARALRARKEKRI